MNALLDFIGGAALVSLTTYHLTGSLVPFGLREWRHDHHHHEPESVYGIFPKANDPFSFLPCTNATIPPALDDQDHEASWARLFDSDPSHWSWGNKTAEDADDADDAYAGRGIFLCGYIDVPLDYLNAADNRIVRLALTKYQVSGLARADGSSPPGAGDKSERTLVLEPGGPGGSGTSMAWRASQDLTRRFTRATFDTLGWDPRGVNASQPAISCFPYDADRDRWHMLTGLYREESADPETLLRWADAMYNATFRACREQHGDLGRFMTTALVARDLEEIRRALGERELTGYFVSYGTGIGQTWASMFPDSVGRLILDGTEYVRDHRLLGGFVSIPTILVPLPLPVLFCPHFPLSFLPEFQMSILPRAGGNSVGHAVDFFFFFWMIYLTLLYRAGRLLTMAQMPGMTAF